MMATVGPSQTREARPIDSQKAEGGLVWFFTSKAGRAAGDLMAGPGTLLVCQDERSAYLSVRGQARITEDPSEIQPLWKEAYKVRFPAEPAIRI